MDAVITQNPHAAISVCVRIFTNLRDRASIERRRTPRSQVIFREKSALRLRIAFWYYP